jgi:hypothetical protein
MRFQILGLSIISLLFAAATAQAGSSCSTFATVKAYDEASKSITIEKAKGSETKFFPKTEGAPKTSKIPAKCKSKVLKQASFPVKATGGRMSITQVRANFSGKMLNDTEDKTWVPKQLEELVDGETTVVVLIRQGLGKDAPYGITTIYLPVTQEELDELARLEAQAKDVD